MNNTEKAITIAMALAVLALALDTLFGVFR